MTLEEGIEIARVERHGPELDDAPRLGGLPGVPQQVDQDRAEPLGVQGQLQALIDTSEHQFHALTIQVPGQQADELLEEGLGLDALEFERLPSCVV